MKNRTAQVMWLFIGLLVIGIGPGPVWAQKDQDAKHADEKPEAATVVKEAAPQTAPRTDAEVSTESTSSESESGDNAAATSPATVTSTPSGLISVDFKDADIRQVLRVIALKSGVDIVAGSDVEALVSIKLSNVPWEQALDLILRTYGFTYERKGKIVRVMTVDALEKEALSTEVFPLDYAKAKDVPDVIKEMLSDRGKVKFDERTNTIIVTDTPTALYQIKEVIKRIDQRTPQVLIETRVVETRLNKNENLGIDWSDSLTLAASAVSLPSTFPFPAGHSLGGVGQLFIPRAGAFSPSGGALLTQGRVPDFGGTFSFGTLSSTGLQTVLNFLHQRTDTHIVSNPSIAALNNQQAKVHIGSEFPIPNYSIDPTTGKTTITGYTPKNIGTVLTVTPHVNPSEEIVVDLKPEVISFAGNRTYDTGSGASASLPEFTTQTAQTQVRIKAGDTIAIGGLVKETDSKVESKVPILGDIPIIGLLFKNSQRYGGSDPVRQDLLIFLTVKMMHDSPPNGQSVASVQPTQTTTP